MARAPGESRIPVFGSKPSFLPVLKTASCAATQPAAHVNHSPTDSTVTLPQAVPKPSSRLIKPSSRLVKPSSRPVKPSSRLVKPRTECKSPTTEDPLSTNQVVKDDRTFEVQNVRQSSKRPSNTVSNEAFDSQDEVEIPQRPAVLGLFGKDVTMIKSVPNGSAKDKHNRSVILACLTPSPLETEEARKREGRKSLVQDPPACFQPISTSSPQQTQRVSPTDVGRQVSVGGSKVGLLRYVGPIQLANGLWCGVELDEPAGLNDGSLAGVRYFQCRPQHGIIAPASKVTFLPVTPKRRKRNDTYVQQTPTTTRTTSSGPFSLLEVQGMDEGQMWKIDDEVLSAADSLGHQSQTPQSAASTPTPGSSTASSSGVPPLPMEWSRTNSIQQHQHEQLSKQSSFEMDDSLGILTPDQMADFTICGQSPWNRDDIHNILTKDQMATSNVCDQLPWQRDATMSILTADQMAEFAMCGQNPWKRDVRHSYPQSTSASNENDHVSGKRLSLQLDDRHEESNTTQESSYGVGNVTVVEMNDFLLRKLSEMSREESFLDQVSFPDCDSMIADNQDSLMEENVVDELKSPDRVMVVVDEERPKSGVGVFDEVSKSGSEADFTPASLRVDISDRTLSPEELPMDTPLHEESNKTDEAEDCSRGDHTTLTGSSSAGPSSRSSAAPLPTLPAPTSNSFVTSVTSITSLDNGYQGDGEWSRPASRGADHSPTGPLRLKPPPPPLDPMTDSDFFTESDADAHEDHTTTGRRGGDRRAQVIDGTLYSGNPQHQRCPSFTASINEEMESSGVYSDLERRPEDPPSASEGVKKEIGTNIELDFSPDGSTKTISSKSEPSQVKDLPQNFTIIQESPTKHKDSTFNVDDGKVCNMLTENNLKNHQQMIIVSPVLTNTDDRSTPMDVDVTSQSPPQMDVSTGMKETGSSPTTKLDYSNVTNVSKTSSKEEGHLHQLKKYKMPKRNVVSKIKAMIESSPVTPAGGSGRMADENQENRRPSRASRKGGKWDAVMNKIAQSQEEQKLKPSKLKEVKSKVFASIGPLPTPHVQHETRARKGSAASPAGSRHSNLPLKPKSRRARTRTSSSSLQQQQNPQQVGCSNNSSPHSSMSDLSLSTTNQLQNTSKASTKSVASLRSSKKRDVGRSASPLSDGSTNSATSHVMARPVANNHTPRPSGQKNGVSPVADMKTPTVRKQASRRGVSNAGQKPTPLRDHNRLAGGGGVVKTAEPLAKLQSPPQQAATLPRTTQSAAVSPALPPPLPVTPKVDALLPQLRHAAAGFEALSVLVQYLVQDLDAFSTQHLKRECDAMKTEWLRTKLDLEELQVSYQRVQDAITEERTTHGKAVDEHKETLLAVETKNGKEKAQLIEQYDIQLADYEKKFQQELENVHRHYASEQTRLEAMHVEREESILRDGQERLELARRDHDAGVARLQEERRLVEEELRTKLGSLESENATLKEQARKLMDTMHKDKDTKLQATAARCRELQDEVQSLQTVLELRHNELQELRRQCASLSHEANELPGALQRASALQARVEDLQAQLQHKTSFERQLSQEHRLLVESLHQESKQKKRLSLHNEELQWKLKQNSEVVSVLAAMNGASMTGSLQLPPSSSPATSRRSMHSSTQSLSESFSRTPSRAASASRPGDLSTQLLRAEAEEEPVSSPPASPKVKGIVEKSDSVSWVLEMEESSEELVSRLVRRAGSFRGTTPPLTNSPAPHSRTLPPPKRQRCKAASLCLSASATSVSRAVAPLKNGHATNGATLMPVNSNRSRSRSVSADPTDDIGVDYITWVPASSTPKQRQQMSGDNGNLEAGEELVLAMKNTAKTSFLKHCGDDVGLRTNSFFRADPSHEEALQWRSNTSECSNDDSPVKSSSSCASTSSSSSSSSSDGSIRNGGNGGGVSDREYRQLKKNTTKLLLESSDPRRSLELVEADVLPLPPLPGSGTGSDLSLLAACAAAQPALMPKESAGEAMISEETSEDENDDRDDDGDVGSTSDERSCSDDDEESTSESSSGLGPGRGSSGGGMARGLQASCDDDDSNSPKSNGGIVAPSGQQNLDGSNQQYHLLMMSDSGSFSTTTTTMDLSWSEDMELMPSESEG